MHDAYLADFRWSKVLPRRKVVMWCLLLAGMICLTVDWLHLGSTESPCLWTSVASWSHMPVGLIRNASNRFHKFGGRICQPRCFLPQGTRVQRALSRSPVQVCMDCAPNRSWILKGLVLGSRIPLPTDPSRFHAGLDFVNFGDRLEVDRNFAFRIWKALSCELRLNVETNQLNKQMCFYFTVSF